MKQKFTASLLVLALVSAIAVSAFATESTPPILISPAPTPTEAPAAETGKETTETPSGDVAADSAEEILDQAPAIAVEEASPNMVMFADLAGMVKKNSPSYLALAANTDAIDEAADQVAFLNSSLVQINTGIAEIDKELAVLDQVPGLSEEELQAARKTLQAEKAKLQKQKEQVQVGISSLSALASQDTSQLESSANQLILGCETMYIALVGLEIQEDALVRQLASLDRTLAELKIRHEGGQVSQLQVMEAESGRASLVSGLTTLRMNMTNLRMQLENLLGEEITGTIAVGALPRVTSDQLSAVDPEKDLKQVLRRSPSVQAAETQQSSLFDSGLTGDLRESMFDAADYGVKSAKLQAEMSFRSLYAELMDNRQALTAAQGALEVEQLAYQAAELKFNQGSISKNALLTAADELQTAKEAVLTAENNLFSTYNEYTWAVKYGIFM